MIGFAQYFNLMFHFPRYKWAYDTTGLPESFRCVGCVEGDPSLGVVAY